MEYQTETLPNGTPVYTTQSHRVTTDSLLLTAFCPVHRRHSACDLGAGTGLILLGLVDRGLAGRAVGVEQYPDAAALLQKAAQDAGLANVAAHTGDLREYTCGRPFDLVVSNPPYFTEGQASPQAARAAARHAAGDFLPALCAAAHRLLKDSGSFCLCWPPARLAPLLAALQGQNLAPKRLQLVRKGPAAAPWLALLDARKAGGEGLAILPDHILPPGQQVRY